MYILCMSDQTLCTHRELGLLQRIYQLQRSLLTRFVALTAARVVLVNLSFEVIV